MTFGSVFDFVSCNPTISLFNNSKALHHNLDSRANFIKLNKHVILLTFGNVVTSHLAMATFPLCNNSKALHHSVDFTANKKRINKNAPLLNFGNICDIISCKKLQYTPFHSSMYTYKALHHNWDFRAISETINKYVTLLGRFVNSYLAISTKLQWNQDTRALGH